MSKDLPAPRLASVDQTAALLALSVPTIYRLISSHQLDTVKIGRRRLIRMASIEALTGEKAA